MSDWIFLSGLLLANVAATLFLTGVVWSLQMVQFPLMLSAKVTWIVALLWRLLRTQVVAVPVQGGLPDQFATEKPEFGVAVTVTLSPTGTMQLAIGPVQPALTLESLMLEAWTLKADAHPRRTQSSRIQCPASISEDQLACPQRADNADCGLSPAPDL